MKLKPDDIVRLYPNEIYILPGETIVPEEIGMAIEEEAETEAPVNAVSSIIWRTKPGSKVLFIARPDEIRDKELGELLKNIVQSIGIPFDQAGFGLITGDDFMQDLEMIPNPFGVVFESTKGENPLMFQSNKVFFSFPLSELAQDRDKKKVLWEQLKEIKKELDQ